MTPGPRPEGGCGRVALVVAATDARTTALASLGRFADEVRGRGELVVVDASRDGTAGRIARALPEARVIRRPPGTLTPELWRDGLRATEAPLVAFSTAAMRPEPGWLDALLARLDATEAAAVGGPIEPSDTLGTTDRAVYLLRYVNYWPPLSLAVEPPGDNALYRRERLTGLERLIEGGFWEAEVHQQLRRRGDRLVMADRALLTYLGGCRLGESLRLRHRHARRYGASRASGMRAGERWARSAAAPLVPLVLARRIAWALRSRGRSLRPWLAALPGLGLLLTAWAAGETQGTWTGVGSGLAGSWER